MHAEPDLPDDLSELEQRLAARQPARDGLDADAMLFAAGRAAAKPGPARYVWPVLTCLTSAAAVFLAVRLGDERSQRLVLVAQIRQQSSSPAAPAPVSVAPTELAPTDDPSPDSFLVARRALDGGLESWPPLAMTDSAGPIQPDGPIFQVGQRDTLLQP